MPPRRLSDAQQRFFKEHGYLTGLPVFDEEEVRDLNEGLNELATLLRPGESTQGIREWHESSRWLFDITTHDSILDYVKDLLGPNFFLWASNYFLKESHTPQTVRLAPGQVLFPVAPDQIIDGVDRVYRKRCGKRCDAGHSGIT